jgi:hypothetical protein
MGGPATVRPFSFACGVAGGSSLGVSRKGIRWGIALLLVVIAAGVGWWVGKYERSPDPAARYRLEWVELRRDHSFFWVEARLKRTGEKDHDLRIPVRLKTEAGKRIGPADTALSGAAGQGTTGLHFKFWLEREDLAGPLELELNGGHLKLRTGSGIPELGTGASKMFRSNRW